MVYLVQARLAFPSQLQLGMYKYGYQSSSGGGKISAVDNANSIFDEGGFNYIAPGLKYHFIRYWGNQFTWLRESVRTFRLATPSTTTSMLIFFSVIKANCELG